SVSVLYQQVHLRPPHLRAFNSDVPRELARIVEQALAKHPAERFGTAALLAEALYPFSQDRVPSLPGLITFPQTLPRATTGTLPPAPGPAAAAASPPPGAIAGGAGPLPPLRDTRLSTSGPLAPLPAEAFSAIAPVGADVRPVLPPPDSVWQPAPSS